MNHHPLPTAVVLAATTATLVTACGNGNNSPKSKGKIEGAQQSGMNSASPTPASDSGHPDLTLPSDITESFVGWTTGDRARDAILTASGRAQTAVTHAVVEGDPQDPGLRFYQADSALSGSRDWVKSIVDSGSTFTGTVRYYAPRISIFDKKSAAVSYCSDESKAFNKDRKTKKVEEPPTSNDSYVMYSTRLKKTAQGVWQTTKLESERGSKSCAP